jgi:superfamily II DNA or RNA helicase
VPYQQPAGATAPIDVALASNIIEVGVDVDRLPLIGIVGQPKTTAQYIQVTGRVGRRWWERPGLVAMLYNPSKARDRSHFEQFRSYHRRLYERVDFHRTEGGGDSEVARWGRGPSFPTGATRGGLLHAVTVDAVPGTFDRCRGRGRSELGRPIPAGPRPRSRPD